MIVCWRLSKVDKINERNESELWFIRRCRNRVDIFHAIFRSVRDETHSRHEYTHTFMVFSHNSNEIQWKYKSLSSSRSCELVIWFFFSFYFHRSIWVMFQRKTASFKFNYIMCININESIDVIWVALVRCCTFSVCLTHSCHGNIIGQTRTGLIIDKKTHNFVTIYVRYEFFLLLLSFCPLLRESHTKRSSFSRFSWLTFSSLHATSIS